MKFSEIELPSNKKFGFFFTMVFLLAAGYFFVNNSSPEAYIFVTFAGFFLVVTLLKSDFLLPLNKIWMRFGWLLGIIVSPIILGLIFFTIFTPVALFMRLYGRDDLRLKLKIKTTHWISRDEPIEADSFKNQF